MRKEALEMLSDSSILTRACVGYYEQTGSTASIVALLQLRKILEKHSASEPAVEAGRAKDCPHFEGCGIVKEWGICHKMCRYYPPAP